MKIVAIRGKNLASLEGEFVIDFTVEPLCSAGIFAITGSTGAESQPCWMPYAWPCLIVRRV